MVSFLGSLEHQHRLLLYVADPFSSEWTERCLRQAPLHTTKGPAPAPLCASAFTLCLRPIPCLHLPPSLRASTAPFNASVPASTSTASTATPSPYSFPGGLSVTGGACRGLSRPRAH